MRTALFTGFLGVCGMACACGGSLPRPPYVPQPDGALAIVPIPPPPPRVERVPDSPARGAVWVDGEWVYRRGRWAWMLGRWVRAPEGTFFSPWAIVRGREGAIYFASGAWRDRRGKAVDPPPPLALASASAGAVVDAEGVIQATGRTLTPASGIVSAPLAPPAAEVKLSP